ncbi:MAG: NAD+ synthase [Candidatus Gottesmanbacteria bacterium]|nr:NAD+ synthase [Candidatus Gottesmanbacteria bacterium]
MTSADPKTISEHIVGFLKQSFAAAGFSDAVVGLSGGIDSAVSCILAVRAIGIDHVYPVLLPYGALSTQATLDAMSIIEMLKISPTHVARVDIKPILDPVTSKEFGMDNIRRGNLMARARMMILYDHAKKRSALVVGTENKSEYLLGYFTRFGDEASDIEPLRNLYKTQLYDLAKYLGVPDAIIAKKPTAGLWEGQTDEGEFGFTYKDADEILFLSFDEKKSADEIVAAGFSKDIVDKVLARAHQNDFKHNLPILP